MSPTSTTRLLPQSVVHALLAHTRAVIAHRSNAPDGPAMAPGRPAAVSQRNPGLTVRLRSSASLVTAPSVPNAAPGKPKPAPTSRATQASTDALYDRFYPDPEAPRPTSPADALYDRFYPAGRNGEQA